MTVVLILLAAVVLLLGILILTRLDRLERKIDALARHQQPAAPARPHTPGAIQSARKPQTGASCQPDPASQPATAQPTATGVVSTPSANLAAWQTTRTVYTAPAAEPAAPGASTIPAPPPIPPRPRQTPPPVPVPTPRVAPRPRKTDYEKYIGENLFGKIGIFVLIVGVGFFVKYAIDNNWLGETMRTALGFAVGAALMGVAARLRDKYRSFSSLLAGGAFAVCFVTTAVAYHYYKLFPQAWAFALLIVLTLLMTAIALRYNRRELAVTALAGGLLAPFLASGNSGDYVFLFCYLSILHAGMFALSLHKRWWELPIVSFTATYLILGVFVGGRSLFSGSLTQDVARNMLGFSTLFFLLFALSAIAVFRTEKRKVHTWLVTVVTLNNFLYLGFGLLFLSKLCLEQKADGALPLLIAAVNAATLWSIRRRECPAQLSALLLGMTVLFLTIAIPIQLQTNTILICWAAEAVVLLTLYIRTRTRVYDGGAAALCLLTLLFGLVLLTTGYDTGAGMCRSGEFLSALFAAFALGAAAWLTQRRREVFSEAHYVRYIPVNTLLIAGAFALFYLVFIREFHDHLSGVVQRQAILLFSVSMLAGAGRLLRNRFPISDFQSLYFAEAVAGVCLYLFLSGNGNATGFAAAGPWLSACIVALILTDVAVRYYKNSGDAKSRTRFTTGLNLLATLLWITVVCRLLSQLGMRDEFSAGFSAALIAAGTVQMALGMQRHQKVLRIFSLGVFAVVLVKLLVHDLWGLPTIGRIVVFILLGAILLVLSFLYQRLKTALFKEDE